MAKNKTNSKVLSGAFERAICRLLSMWWSLGKDDNVFYRTEGSGGRATKRARAGKGKQSRCGDVGLVEQTGKPFLDMFAVEIKKGYSKDTIQDLLDKPGVAAQTYETWLEQARESKQNSGSFSWMIIVRRKKRKSLVMLPAKLWAGLTSEEPQPFATLHIDAETIIVLPLDHFTENVKPNHVRSIMWADNQGEPPPGLAYDPELK